jgi:serine/threonine protein kinase
MEYVEGEPLSQVLSERGSLSPEETVSLLAPVLQALAYLHSKGIIHRDIKPSNIMVSPTHGARLIDFGIAKALAEDLKLTQTGTQVGTVLYMAPEQIVGRPVSTQTDLYAMGLVLYECFFGRYPWEWEGLTLFQIHEKLLKEPPPIPEWAPKAWNSFFEKALAKEPGDRFSSAEEMLEALREIASSPQLSSAAKATPIASLASQSSSKESRVGLDPSPRSATSTQTPPPSLSPKKKRFRVGFFLLLLLVGVVGALLAYQMQKEEISFFQDEGEPKSEDYSPQIREALERELTIYAQNRSSPTYQLQWLELPTSSYALTDSVLVPFRLMFQIEKEESEKTEVPCYLSGIPIGKPRGKQIVHTYYSVKYRCTQQSHATVYYRYWPTSGELDLWKVTLPPSDGVSCEELSREKLYEETGPCE